MSVTSSVDIENVGKEQFIDEVLVFNKALEVLNLDTSDATETFNPFDLEQYPRTSTLLCERMVGEDFETEEENVDYAIFCEGINNPFKKIHPRGPTINCGSDFICGNLINNELEQKLLLKQLIKQYAGPDYEYYYNDDNVETLLKVYSALKKQYDIPVVHNINQRETIIPTDYCENEIVVTKGLQCISSPSVLKCVYNWQKNENNNELNETDYKPIPMPKGYSYHSSTFLETSDNELDKNILSISQQNDSSDEQINRVQTPLPIGYRKDGTQVRSTTEWNNFNLEYQPFLKSINDGYLPIFLPNGYSLW